MRQLVSLLTLALVASVSFGQSYQAAPVGDRNFTPKAVLSDGAVVGELSGQPAKASPAKGGYEAPEALSIPGNPARKGKVASAGGTAMLIDWGEKNQKTVFDLSSSKDLTPKRGGNVVLIRLFGVSSSGQPVGHVAIRSSGKASIGPAIFQKDGKGDPKTFSAPDPKWTGELFCASGDWCGGDAQNVAEEGKQKALVIKPSGSWEYPCDSEAGAENSLVIGISDKGDAIGRMTVKGKDVHFVWNPKAGLQKLAEGTKVASINKNGLIVGTSAGKASVYDAATKKWADLNAQVSGLKATLTECLGVNDQGQILANASDGKTYVLTPSK